MRDLNELVIDIHRASEESVSKITIEQIQAGGGGPSIAANTLARMHTR